MAEACRLAEGNPGLELGLSLGEGWRDGPRQGLHRAEPGGFGLWAEQLLAESTGKQGKGLVPAPGESPDGPDRQAQEVRVSDPYELGQEFFRWEFATAVAGSILGINPFDQPDVQAAKDKTNEVLASGGADVLAEGSADELLAQAQPGDYVCIQAFVNPTDANEQTDARARRARARGDRLRRHARLRPALPALDRPAAQGRPERRASSCRSSTTPARSSDPGPAVRLRQADPRAGRGRLRVAARSAAAASRASDIEEVCRCSSG